MLERRKQGTCPWGFLMDREQDTPPCTDGIDMPIMPWMPGLKAEGGEKTEEARRREGKTGREGEGRSRREREEGRKTGRTNRASRQGLFTSHHHGDFLCLQHESREYWT